MQIPFSLLHISLPDFFGDEHLEVIESFTGKSPGDTQSWVEGVDLILEH